MNEQLRISHEKMEDVFYQTLLKHSFNESAAKTCAGIFADNSLNGIYTHGVNRFARFIQSITQKHVVPANVPTKTSGFGAMEQWNGNLGPGPNNALLCTKRAMELAAENGIGCVALANTNHWMRGGYYGWHAAKHGYAFICWTNTIANMPAWGSSENKLGNNPLIFAVPKDDEAVVLDMAVSQFSFGAMDNFFSQQKALPVAGGYDVDGKLTNDPEKILQSKRSLPIGYWKGSGLALLLDVLATILSGGKSTHEITEQKSEYAVSQVFIAIKLSSLSNRSSINNIISSIIEDYHSASTDDTSNQILYPGERVLKTREENKLKGIPVNAEIWNEILGL